MDQWHQDDKKRELYFYEKLKVFLMIKWVDPDNYKNELIIPGINMVANIFISQLSLWYWCNYKFAWMRNKRSTLHTWKAQVDQLSLPLNMDYGSSLLILTKSIMVRREAESPKCVATSPSLDKGSYETTGPFLPRVFWSFLYLEKCSLHRCPSSSLD